MLFHTMHIPGAKRLERIKLVGEAYILCKTISIRVCRGDIIQRTF